MMVVALGCAAAPVREERIGPAPALFVRSVGRGPALITVSGGPGATSDYLRSLERMTRHGYTVVTWDQRGVGASEPPTDEDFGLAAYVGDLERVVDHVSPRDRVFVLGHSWGGLLALAYAIDHPERVEALLLVDSGAPDLAGRDRTTAAIDAAKKTRPRRPIPAGLPASCAPWWDAFVVFYADPDRIDVRDLPSQCDLRVNDATWTALGAYSLREGMARVTVPTLVVYGEADPMAFMSEEIARELPRARAVGLPACGHRPMAECWPAFEGAVRGFLSEQR